MTDQYFICELTKKLWDYYLLEPSVGNLEEVFSQVSEQFVLIGTGKSEYHTSLDKFIADVVQGQNQLSIVPFNMVDYWQEFLPISQDAALVYGGFRALQSEHIDAIVDMDTRFSIIYHKKDGVWKILHLHHSVPFTEQEDGEYYPKSLSEKVENATKKADLYKLKSETDYMTRLNNKETFKLLVNKQLTTYDKGNMILFDLDYFKEINDNYGHIIGDEILKLFASCLKKYFDSSAILGRMSGDEFFIFEYLPLSREKTIHKIESFRKAFEDNSKLLLDGNKSSFSIGIASVSEQEYSFDMLVHKADTALYRAKNLGRQTYHWNE